MKNSIVVFRFGGHIRQLVSSSELPFSPHCHPLAVILKTMKLISAIFFVIQCISCSDKEDLATIKCYNDFFAGSKDCVVNYFDTSNKPSLQSDTYSFDLNGDNQTDISFDPEIWGSPYRDWIFEPQPIFYLDVTLKLGTGCEVYINDLGQPDSVSYGLAFSKCGKWDNTKNKYLLSSFENICEFNETTGPTAKLISSGTFYNVQNKYLLFRLNLNNDTILSWFNISCDNNGYMKINNYAYIRNK